MKYFFVSIALVLGFAFFEAAILSNILFLPAMPDFLLICVLYWSFTHGRKLGVTTGFISGIVIDFLCGSPLGLNAILRTTIGYTSGFLSRTFNTSGILLPIIIVAAGTFYKAILSGFISIFYPNIVNTYHIFSSLFLSELLLNIFFSVIVFKFLSVFESLYSTKEQSAL